MCTKISCLLILLLIQVQLGIVRANAPLPRVPPDSNDPNFTVQYLIKINRQVHSPYRKFGLTYDKFSVCELRNMQKISVCNSVLTSKMFKFEELPLQSDHLDLSCKRRLVDLSEGVQVTDTQELSLSMYECPNPYRNEKSYHNGTENEMKFFIPIHFYIVGGYFRNSVVLSYMHVNINWDVPVRFHTVVLGIPLSELQFFHALTRSEIYEEQTGLKNFMEPSVERVKGSDGTIQRKPSLAEAKVLDNNQIKEKSVYSKFMSTYNIINICAMEMKIKVNLCKQVFESSAYNLHVSESQSDVEFRCIRRKVVLLHSSAGSLTFTEVGTFKCLIKRELTLNYFYLGSMLKFPGLIAFMLIPPFVEKLPDAYITGLNSDGVINKSPKIASPRAKKKDPPLDVKLGLTDTSTYTDVINKLIKDD